MRVVFCEARVCVDPFRAAKLRIGTTHRGPTARHAWGVARQEGALAMFNVDRLIVDRIILAVCDVMFIELQEHGRLVWVPVTASGVCLSRGPQLNTLHTCRCCRRTSVQAVWPKSYGSECSTCYSYCRVAFKVADERHIQTNALATQLLDDVAFEKWQKQSWQKYIEDSYVIERVLMA